MHRPDTTSVPQPIGAVGLVVLGCRVGPGYSLRGVAQRRIDLAADLYRGGGFQVVIVSGGVRWGGVLEAEAMALGLSERGVPTTEIVREAASRNTRENARYSSRLARVLGLEKLVIVSSSWHLPRAEALFREWGGPIESRGAQEPALSDFKRRSRELRERLALGRDLLLSRRGW